MEEQAETKDDIRRRMRAIRRALAPEERERAAKVICAKLIDDDLISVAADPFEGGGAVAVYLASPDEIDLSEFILEMLERGVKVVAPRWNGETYELAKLKSLSEGDLRHGPMNILEPAEAEIVRPSEVAAWIVPGLAFTIRGDRLGYGGGWYDRLMADAKGFKIGVAHEFQIVKNLPHEPHDIPLIRIVTDDLSDMHVEFTETEDGCCGLLGLVASTVFLWFSDWTISLSATAPLLNWLSALSVVFIALVPIVWTALFLAVGYHALWTLFGRHRLTVTGANCEYEARLGPRAKRKSFVLSSGSHATSYPGNSLCVTAADGEHHYCFDNLPPRCYLPLTVFVRKHALKLA